MLAALVADLVELHLLVPDVWTFLRFDDLHLVDFFDNAEHAGEHAVDGEVGAQCLVVEVVEFLATLLCPVGQIPRLHWLWLGFGLLRAVLLQFGDLLFEGFPNAVVEVVDEVERSGTVFGHAALENVVGEVLVPEQFGLLLAQAQDLENEVRVVLVPTARDGPGSFPHLFAEGLVLDVVHEWPHRRVVEIEAPLALVTFLLGIVRGSGEWGGR